MISPIEAVAPLSREAVRELIEQLRKFRRAFPRRLVSLPPTKILPLFERLAGAGIQGGAAYDAIVAETARLSGLRLISLDERAQSMCRAVGVDVAWLID